MTDSTASIAELAKQINDATIILFRSKWAKSVDLAEIYHFVPQNSETNPTRNLQVSYNLGVLTI
ncbi:unnamed protein product [Malus baccata var. baccata]